MISALERSTAVAVKLIISVSVFASVFPDEESPSSITEKLSCGMLYVARNSSST